MLGPRLIDTQPRDMMDGTTTYATGTPCLVKDSRVHAIAYCERYRLMAGDSSSPFFQQNLYPQSNPTSKQHAETL